MKRLLLSLLAVTFLLAPALGQAPPGMKDRIKRTLDNAQNQRNEQMENAGVADANTAKQDAGWITRTAPDGTKVRLYVAAPHIEAGTTPNLPALVVVQEWWGVNEDIRQRTEEFAAKGYFAVAVDLYDGKVTDKPEEAAELKGKLTDPAALTRMKTAVNYLTAKANDKIVDEKKIGVVGWCMGGTQALNLAANDPRIDAVAVFYPGSPLSDPKKLKNIKGPVFGVFGKTDKNPSPEQVDKLAKALEEAGVKHTFHSFEGVGHAFASKAAQKTGMYNEEKAQQAWKEFYTWLETTLPTNDAPATAPQ